MRRSKPAGSRRRSRDHIGRHTAVRRHGDSRRRHRIRGGGRNPPSDRLRDDSRRHRRRRDAGRSPMSDSRRGGSRRRRHRRGADRSPRSDSLRGGSPRHRRRAGGHHIVSGSRRRDRTDDRGTRFDSRHADRHHRRSGDGRRRRAPLRYRENTGRPARTVIGPLR
jgi:hypothetical protein